MVAAILRRVGGGAVFLRARLAGAGYGPVFARHPARAMPPRGGVPPPPPDSPVAAPDAALLARLRATGRLPPARLEAALEGHRRHGTPVQDHLIAHGALTESMLLQDYAAALGCGMIPGGRPRADARAVDLFGADACLSQGLAPLGRRGGAMVIAAARPGAALAAEPELRRLFGRVRFVLAPAAVVDDALLRVRRVALTDRAEERVPAEESCRGWSEAGLARAGALAATAAAGLLLLAPVALLALGTCLSLLALVASSAMKAAAGWAALTRPGGSFASTRMADPPLPVISVLVPLFREREIAGRLVRRLARLTYPRDRLEICLVVEEDDATTRAALTEAALPRHMRLVTVPRGAVKTKPRALNYALPFCRGSIIGIYDAEDEPEPDQLHRVAAGFAAAAPDVACLQGVLDFYNAGENWLSRCFAIEYATWFRVILPGLSRMGLVVPLGGTTLFFRRTALEALGAWDAHNVTEDADLGLRLARHGFRTLLIGTVTAEEANCRAWPWIRQRSRWLKGYAMTWGAHMRRPRGLRRGLGFWRFWGVQALFLGTVVQHLTAPLLWSLALIPLGFPHPLLSVLGPGLIRASMALFLTAEAINLVVGVAGARRTRHLGLAFWTPTMMLYFPMCAVAAWKGVVEIATRPYYWDKTSHGLAQSPQIGGAPVAAAA